MRKHLYAKPQKEKMCSLKRETCHSSLRERKWKKWDEDDLRTPVEDKNSNQALRIISSCFPFNYVQKYSLLSPQDVFVPLIKIFSLSRNCIEKEKEDQPMLSEKIFAHDVFYKNIFLLYNIAFFLMWC